MKEVMERSEKEERRGDAKGVRRKVKHEVMKKRKRLVVVMIGWRGSVES